MEHMEFIHMKLKMIKSSDLIIKEINENKKIIAIGETGLDFYYNQ